MGALLFLLLLSWDYQSRGSHGFAISGIKKSYTSKGSHWDLFLLISCETIEQAVFIELKIKTMKSRKYKENLKKYPEMINKMLDAFTN